jgi:hypothetical protein
MNDIIIIFLLLLFGDAIIMINNLCISLIINSEIPLL